MSNTNNDNFAEKGASKLGPVSATPTQRDQTCGRTKEIPGSHSHVHHSGLTFPSQAIQLPSPSHDSLSTGPDTLISIEDHVSIANPELLTRTDVASHRSPSPDSLFGGDDIEISFDSDDPASPGPSEQAQTSTNPSSDADHSRNITPATTSSVVTIPPHQNNPSYGLKWVDDWGSIRPEWAVELRVESIIATLQSALGPDKEFDVRHWHDGALSKLYRISFDQKHFMMRVCLPVCPKTKTESEVATLRWVDENTKLPVPRVKAFDASRDNPLGFEWILMTMIEGTPLSQCLHTTTQGAKERIVTQLAAYAAAAYAKQFTGGIGNIYPTSPDAASSELRGERAEVDHSRGPFRDAAEWVDSRLRLAVKDLTWQLHGMSNVQRKATQKKLELLDRLEVLVARFFPAPQDNSDQDMVDMDVEGREGQNEERHVPTVLWHDNLSADNLLVDENGMLFGVIDWQCVSCLPLYEACQFPTFLQQAVDRLAEPMTVRYIIPGSGELDPIYESHLRQHEVTLLRQLYIQELLYHSRDLVKVWMDETNADLRDFEAAVQNFGNDSASNIVERWVAAVEKGEKPGSLPRRLHEQLMQ
ncbi:Uu.00g054730.m01.CDS01 [Anthostomella pinea]|uniref:Uu.00g054730.m01.CDS01 n=1 Tax=Anthostomella pinea TaxID=933095 RepID=A0AAI8VWR2_9PEZI|nr:Uu.00g054730.m01.CDS01 [Anthostomella pinea]